MSYVNPDHLSFFKFIGRVVGKALYDNVTLEAYFTRSFYKHMLQKPVTTTDMEAHDPEVRGVRCEIESQSILRIYLEVEHAGLLDYVVYGSTSCREQCQRHS